MYNFLSKHRKKVGYAICIIFIIIAGLLIYFAPTIFEESNVYFYTSSTIAQGFIALVALLGTVVVFKVQLEDQSMQKLSDGIEPTVVFYRGSITRTYTPTQMMNACKEIWNNEKENSAMSSNVDLIKKVGDKMQETLASRNETRSRLVNFAVISFLNIAIALISILLTPIFVKYWYIGGFLLSANVCLSIFSLSRALQLVRKALGYDFSIKL